MSSMSSLQTSGTVPSTSHSLQLFFVNGKLMRKEMETKSTERHMIFCDLDFASHSKQRNATHLRELP